MGASKEHQRKQKGVRTAWRWENWPRGLRRWTLLRLGVLTGEEVRSVGSSSHKILHHQGIAPDTYLNEPMGRGCWFIWSIPGCAGGPPGCQLSFPEEFMVYVHEENSSNMP